MSERGGESKFFAGVQAGVRAQAEKKKLPPLLKKWRYSKSSDHAELPLKPDSARFLTRYSLLDAGRDGAALLADYHALLARLSRSSGDAPGVVAAWIELFAAGEYPVMAAICADEPRCAICPLQAGCRYLAGGSRDARLSGANLARELLRAGDSSAQLGAAEVLAFVLAGEQSGAADFARAEALLKACHGVRGVLQAGAKSLRELGLSDAAAARVQATAKLCRLWADERAARGRAFATGRDFFDEFHLRLRELKQEVFVVVLLDQKNGWIADEQVTVGSLTETLVHPREVFARAIELRAAALALVHNHPSGDPAPSAADKAITKRIESVAKLVGIRLLDHIIVGDGRYVSFVEEGLLAP